jgi:menaquinone-dependent protoporphyrinogen IX oxidase
MRIAILHDSQAGNGEHLATIMQETFEQAGAEVTVGHVTGLAPESVAAEQPDLLVIGAAIRKFRTSPTSKRWLKHLDKALRAKGARIAHGAAFVTHGLPDKAAQGWGTRFRSRLERTPAISEVYAEWLSAKVVAPQGPLEDGTEERFREHARQLLAWMER